MYHDISKNIICVHYFTTLVRIEYGKRYVGTSYLRHHLQYVSPSDNCGPAFVIMTFASCIYCRISLVSSTGPARKPPSLDLLCTDRHSSRVANMLKNTFIGIIFVLLFARPTLADDHGASPFDFQTYPHGNPFIVGVHGYPDAAVYNGTYWVYHANFPGDPNNQHIHAYSSQDLRHWRPFNVSREVILLGQGVPFIPLLLLTALVNTIPISQLSPPTLRTF